jgi:hypothetical protein
VKAETLKADLRKAGAFSQIQEKQITYWLGVRNSAPHVLRECRAISRELRVGGKA